MGYSIGGICLRVLEANGPIPLLFKGLLMNSKKEFRDVGFDIYPSVYVEKSYKNKIPTSGVKMNKFTEYEVEVLLRSKYEKHMDGSYWIHKGMGCYVRIEKKDDKYILSECSNQGPMLEVDEATDIVKAITIEQNELI